MFSDTLLREEKNRYVKIFQFMQFDVIRVMI